MGRELGCYELSSDKRLKRDKCLNNEYDNQSRVIFVERTRCKQKKRNLSEDETMRAMKIEPVHDVEGVACIASGSNDFAGSKGAQQPVAAVAEVLLVFSAAVFHPLKERFELVAPQ